MRVQEETCGDSEPRSGQRSMAAGRSVVAVESCVIATAKRGGAVCFGSDVGPSKFGSKGDGRLVFNLAWWRWSTSVQEAGPRACYYLIRELATGRRRCETEQRADSRGRKRRNTARLGIWSGAAEGFTAFGPFGDGRPLIKKSWSLFIFASPNCQAIKLEGALFERPILSRGSIKQKFCLSRNACLGGTWPRAGSSDGREVPNLLIGYRACRQGCAKGGCANAPTVRRTSVRLGLEREGRIPPRLMVDDGRWTLDVGFGCRSCRSCHFVDCLLFTVY
jgi:hypothetical protein